MTDGPASVSFETTLMAFGNNTGIVVPPDLLAGLAAGPRPPVSVDLNGHVYRTTVGAMGGQHLVSVSTAVRRATGLQAGDAIRVTLVHDATPRPTEVPDDLAAALRADPRAETFFAGLSNSLQRYHLDNIAGAKTADTRQRRIAKAVELFLAGRAREDRRPPGGTTMTTKRSAADPAEKVSGPASYFPSIEKKYGRPIAEWKALVRASPLRKHMELVGWLKAEHGMGHGHANALVAHTLAEDAAG